MCVNFTKKYFKNQTYTCISVTFLLYIIYSTLVPKVCKINTETNFRFIVYIILYSLFSFQIIFGV